MATKDEHLAQIRGGRDACERLERLQQLQQYEERLAFALAERDAAREELAAVSRDLDELSGKYRELKRALKAAQPVARVEIGSPLDAIRVAERLIEQLPKPHDGAASWLMRHGVRECARAYRARWRERMRTNPVGDTEHIAQTTALFDALDAAAAQPAAEAPAPDPRIIKIGSFDAVLLNAEAPAPPAEPGPMRSIPLATKGEAQPAPPQETAQGGPFEWTGFFLLRDGEPCELSNLVPILNAGLEAEQLRARVAELEAHVNSYAQSYQDEKARADAAEARLRDREDSITALETKLAAAEESIMRAWNHCEDADATGIVGLANIDEAVEQICGELKKQDAKVKELTAKLAALGENPITELQSKLAAVELEHARRWTEHTKLDEQEQDELRAKVAKLEAKLAALGENPIRRALVEKWIARLDTQWLKQDVQPFREILAGREPGAQQP